MEHNDKIKKAFWITEDMDREIDMHLKLDNCSSRSEFAPYPDRNSFRS